MDAPARILLVEDNSILVVTISQALRQFGYAVLPAVSTGAAALESAERDAPDLVLMDIELAGPMDGITAAEQIWTAFRIPIIYVTSYATPAIIERAKRSEPFGFLVKPFHLKELHATIETALYKNRMEQALQAANRRLTHEIQERQQVEQALRESELRFRRISELISDYAYVFRINADGTWVREWVTDAFLRITACTPDELEADSGWFTLVHPDDQAIFRQHQQALLAGEKTITEYRIITRYQDVFWLRDYGYPVWSDDLGRVIQVFGAAQDVSEQKQAAEERHRLEMQLYQAQRLEALGTLAGGIAHDFNNILGTMLGYTELLLDTASDGSQERVFLERVHRAGKRAKDLVQQVLTFSRHEVLPLEPINLAPVIEEAVHFLRAAMPANIALRARLRPDCPPILANATQIHQVMVNLCLNAAQAMKPRGGAIDIVLETSRYSGGHQPILGLTTGEYVKITVTDTGTGMTTDVKARIFEPFFTTRAPGEGTGLGLSVVHGILKSHHGVITVESEPGQGTQFRLFFPTTATPEIAPAGPEIAPSVAEEYPREPEGASTPVVADVPST